MPTLWCASACLFGFGMLHLVFPDLAPGIPPMSSKIQFPLPGRWVWSYLSGAIFLIRAQEADIPGGDTLIFELSGTRDRDERNITGYRPDGNRWAPAITDTCANI